jgi:hypothetical protein
MRKATSVAALLLALSYPAYAGDMPNGSPTPPPPQPTTSAQEPAEVGTATGETPAGTADILKQIALDVLAVLPSLL